MAHYGKRDAQNAKFQKMIANAEPPPGPFIPQCTTPGCTDPGPKRFQNGRAFHCEKHALELMAEMNAKDEAERQRREERKKLFDAIRAARRE